MQRYVLAIALDACHGAAVAVLRRGADDRLGLEAQIRQTLLGALAERLGLLGRVDLADPYRHLLVGTRRAAAGLERVAVGDAHHQAGLLGLGGQG